MILNTLLITRVFVLFIGLIAFYCLWISTHLMKKIVAWMIFQASIVLLWFSTFSLYHGRGNPIPLVVVFLTSIFSMGIFGIMLIFAFGVLRRQGSWRIENKNSKRPV